MERASTSSVVPASDIAARSVIFRQRNRSSGGGCFERVVAVIHHAAERRPGGRGYDDDDYHCHYWHQTPIWHDSHELVMVGPTGFTLYAPCAASGLRSGTCE